MGSATRKYKLEWPLSTTAMILPNESWAKFFIRQMMLLRLLMTTNRSRRMGNYKSISGPRATTYVLCASPPKNTEFEASTDIAITENDKSLFKESHKRLIYGEFQF